MKMKFDYEKTIAGFMAALLATTPIAFAAANVGTAFSTLGTNGSLDAVVVVGSGAAASDVAGAVDIAARMAELSYTKTSTTGGSDVNGLSKDGVTLCTQATPETNCQLIDGTNAFPSSGVVKTFHYTGLKDASFGWRGDDYDIREQVDVSAVTMRHSWSSSDINGTPKMQIDSGDVIYEWVAEELLNGTGSSGSKNYTYPVYITMLGKTFAIVSTNADNSFTALSGSIGTATATSGVTYGDYTVYSDLAKDNSWARIIIKDANGNTVDTKVTNEGDSYDSSTLGLTVKVTDVRALDDGTVVGTDVTFGPKGTTEHRFDTSADTTSTGTESDRFPGETDWGIRTGSGFFPAGTAGSIPVNSKIQVVYQPTNTKYLKQGEKLVLPNTYAELGYLGYNTDKFATITIRTVTSQTAYNYSADTQSFGNLNGFAIESDVSGSIIANGGNAYTKAYVLFNRSYGNGNEPMFPVFFGYYDQGKQKILINGTVQQNNTITVAEYVSKLINGSAPADNATYAFKLNYGSVGENDWYLNVSVNSTGNLIRVFGAGTVGASINMTYQNKTVWDSSTTPEFRLGGTAASSDPEDVKVTTEGTAEQKAGETVQDVLDDSGIIVVNADGNANGDKVVLKVPSKTLTNKVYFGKLGATSTGGTVNAVVPVKSAVAVLDTEVTAAHKAKNMVAVGGPCVNSVVADLAASGKFKYSCSGWPGRDFGFISVHDGGFTTGKVVVVVAGTRAADTRLASTVFQQQDLLTGRTDAAVEITSATAAGITAG